MGKSLAISSLGARTKRRTRLDRKEWWNLKWNKEGGEVDEMDVPSCNPLFDLRLPTLVLSTT